jgi:density-regulated protein DRP1
VVLERNTRNKKKCITTVSGLDAFGIKLGEASKLFGKKFASGASIVKNAEGKEHIDCQGDFLDQAAELIVKQWKEVKKSDVFYIDSKKKVPYWPEAAEEEAA